MTTRKAPGAAGICPTCLVNPATTTAWRKPICVPCTTLRPEERERLSAAHGKKAKTAVLSSVYPGRNAEKHEVGVRDTYTRACPKCHVRFLSTLDRKEVSCPFCGEKSGFTVPRGLGDPIFPQIEALSKDRCVRAVLSWIGEGKDGDYHPEDPDDVPYLRFDLYVRESKKGEWDAPEDTSYCTALPAFVSERVGREALARILSETAEPLAAGLRVKRVCESLSWMDESFFPEPPAKNPEDDL